MTNLKNLEIINLSTIDGKLVAILSYQNPDDVVISNNGYDIIEVPVNLRTIQLSDSGNKLRDQSIKKQTAPFTGYSYIEKNSNLTWLLSKYENACDRYMEAENFILEIAEMTWYKRIFCLPKIIRFLDSRSKYNI